MRHHAVHVPVGTYMVCQRLLARRNMDLFIHMKHCSLRNLASENCVLSSIKCKVGILKRKAGSCKEMSQVWCSLESCLSSS
jgi:hypothetical protein